MAFVIRRHGQTHGTPPGPTKSCGRIVAGALTEGKLRLDTASGPLDLRQITLTLDDPNRSADREVRILTNLPAEISAAQVAELHHARWKIETAFMQLATALQSEVDTLAYRQAARFGFVIGLALHNILRTLEAALRAARPRHTAKRLFSLYYLGEEIAEVSRGMRIAIPPKHWRAAADLDDEAWRRQLLEVARTIDVSLYFTEPRRKKKRPAEPAAPPRPKGTRRTRRHTTSSPTSEKTETLASQPWLCCPRSHRIGGARSRTCGATIGRALRGACCRCDVTARMTPAAR